jgi:hypothetical protein
LKISKLPGTGQIPVEMILSEDKTINFIWQKEERPQRWNKPIIAPIYKKGARTDCSTYKGISQLQTMHKILPNIPLSSLPSYVDKITGGSSAWISTWRDQLLIIYSALITSIRKK